MNSESSSDVVQLAAQRAAPVSANLPLVEEASASPEIRALFQQYRERFGRSDLPGILLCFATHPPLLRGMLEIAGGMLFVEGLLTRRHKEMIATFLSLRNACPYCADSHGYFLCAQSGSGDLFNALRSGDLDSPLISSPECALLRLAGKVNIDSQAVTRSDIDAAMQAGWTEAQLAEAVHIAALFAGFNRVANAFGLPSPFPGLL
ncbi:MAG: peroxidase-related enzyme [Acidobacteriaceae bacterium]